jgi:hypothetical protein
VRASSIFALLLLAACDANSIEEDFSTSHDGPTWTRSIEVTKRSEVTVKVVESTGTNFQVKVLLDGSEVLDLGDRASHVPQSP